MALVDCKTDEEFVRHAISTLILERKFGQRGRRYVGRMIRRARRGLRQNMRDLRDQR
jgi:hypothetical protein